jgi:3-oxoacyl-[acyl-carrier-protein] synthase III
MEIRIMKQLVVGEKPAAPGPQEPRSGGSLLGTGMALPERVVPNSWFEEQLDTSDQWIRTRTGIRERRFAETYEQTADYAVAAGQQALEKSGLSVDQIGLVIVATSVPDVRIPATANLVIQRLGLTQAFGYDINAACSGFLFALSAADAQLKAGLADYALVVAADIYSSILDMEDRGTCVLFGDGAGAAVVAPSSAGSGVICSWLHSDGRYAGVLGCRGGGTADRTSKAALGNEKHKIHMQGPLVFRLAVQGCCNAIRQVMRAARICARNLDFIVPHQANMRIIRKIAETFDYPMERIECNLDRYGNTSAASIPIAMHEALEAGRVKAGDLVLLVAAGAGFNSGALLLRM